MSEKLKLCPFCGGEAFVHMLGNEIAKGYYIACDECGAKTIVFGYETEAIEAWNRRAKRKKGKWVRRKDEDCWECSECHAVLENSDIGNHNFYYCYHCGADMMDICGYMDLEKANYE